MKSSLRKIFNPVAEAAHAARAAVHRFAIEKPIKVYTSIYLAADAAGLWYGWSSDHPWWLASSIVGGAASINKLIYGAGGEWKPDMKPPTVKEILRYPAEVVKFAAGVASPSYLKELKHAFNQVSKADVLHLVQSFDLRKHKEKPLDVGMAGYTLTGALIVADGISRGCYIPSLISGTACMAGGAIALLTNRMDLAGRAFSPSSLTVGYMAATTPGQFWSLAGMTLGYMTGNKVVSYVEPEHQTHKKQALTV